MAKNLFAQHWAFIILGSHLSIDVDGNLFSVSADIFQLKIYAEFEDQTLQEWVASASPFEIRSGLRYRPKFYDMKIRLFYIQTEFRIIDWGIPLLREVPSQL